jgi:hypothetical protein
VSGIRLSSQDRGGVGDYLRLVGMAESTKPKAEEFFRNICHVLHNLIIKNIEHMVKFITALPFHKCMSSSASWVDLEET